MKTRRAPSLESLFVATFALLGLRLGLRPLGDNSLFIHLRTGIDLVRTGSIPRSDPYSFTAAGEPWVVQSWLASASYGVAERLGGFPLVRIEQGLLYGLLGWLVASLSRSATPLRTGLAATLSIGAGVVYWSPRPLAFGLVCLAVTILLVERRRAWWWLVPVVWIWVNSHGSFVLGLGWLVLVAVGQRLDGERRPPVLPWIGAFALGLLVACVNPLGPRLLSFPLAVVSKRPAFAEVAEWRPPDLTRATGVFTALFLLAIGVVLVRSRRARPPWADAIPLVAFVASGLLAQRNLPMAAIVAAPVLARSLGRRPDGAMSSRSRDVRPLVNVAIAAALGALAAVFVAVAATQPALAFEGYPVRASRLYARPARVVTTDVAAGYLILRDGREANVFFDDRVDMYPLAMTRDYLRLLKGDADALEVLERRQVDVVVWEARRPLHAQLAASESWRRVGRRDGWLVWVRTR